MNGEGELLPFSISLLTIKRMVVIGRDQGLLPVSLSLMIRTTTMSTKTKAHLPKAWGMMRWVKRLNKFPNHLSHAELRKGRLPQRFTQPTFTMHNERTDPLEYISHFNQRMAVHFENETLMCKVFPSSLEPVTMGWFDGLNAGSIGSFKELT